MSALEEMYQRVIIDNSKNPVGKDNALVEDEHTTHQFNPTCGDEVTLKIVVDGPNDNDTSVVKDIVWNGVGCSISQSSVSIMTRSLRGKTLKDANQYVKLFTELMNSRGLGLEDDEMDKLGDAEVFQGTSKFPARIKCALLAIEAFKDALAKA